MKPTATPSPTTPGPAHEHCQGPSGPSADQRGRTTRDGCGTSMRPPGRADGALLPRPGRASARRALRPPVAAYGRPVRPGKAFNSSLLATALAEQGDAEQASAVGRQAVELTAGLRSARSVRYIRGLQRALRSASGVPAVREFTALVAERLPAASGPAVRQ